MSDLISVIVPVYNAAAYLPRSIGSILNQSHADLEIIAVDDGSSDESLLVLEKLAEEDARLHVLHQVNGGVTKARFTGIAAAKGEWIGFVDADDEIEPDMYERLLRNAVNYHTVISHCGYRTIVNGGERVHFFYNTGRLILQDQATGLKDLIEGTFIEPGLCNKLFHNSLFRSLLQNRDKMIGIRVNEDLLMNYYLFKEAGKSVYEDFCPYHYMANSSSVTRSGFRLYKALDPVKVRKMIYDDIQQGLKDVALRSYLFSCRSAYERLLKKRTNRLEAERLREELIMCRSQWRKLRKSEQLRIRLLLYMPHLYLLLEGIYEKRFQKKKYE